MICHSSQGCQIFGLLIKQLFQNFKNVASAFFNSQNIIETTKGRGEVDEKRHVNLLSFLMQKYSKLLLRKIYTAIWQHLHSKMQ
jgi:hypothetical protein